MSWSNQPLCEECWDSIKPNTRPVRVKDSDEYKCCFCGTGTYSGIWIRERSTDVAYPHQWK